MRIKVLLNLLASISLCVVFTSVCLKPIAQRKGAVRISDKAVLIAAFQGRGTYLMMNEQMKNEISTTAITMAE